MISRLTVLTAVVNLCLSGYIIYSIIDIQNQTKNYVPKSVSIQKNSSNTIDEQIQKTLHNGSENSTEDENPTNEQQSPSDVPTSVNSGDNKIKKYNLSEEEQYSLLDSGSPFGSSPGKNSSELKKLIEKETSDTRTIENVSGEQQIGSLQSSQLAGNEVASTSEALNNKTDFEEIAALKAKKYDIDTEWILGVIETMNESNEKTTIQKDSVSRKGIMQIREDAVPFILQNLGIVYESGLEENVETNIEMGSFYLSYLSKQNLDEHYPFTVYYLGLKEAENLFKESGSYETTFSKSVLQKIKAS